MGAEYVFSGQTIVLAYHALDEQGGDEWTVSPRRLRAQLMMLKCMRSRFLTLEEFRAGLRTGVLPRNSVLVTFDDGYLDFPRTVVPLLDALGVPAVLFVVTDRVGGENSWDIEKGGQARKLADWNDLARIRSQIPRISIGSHTATHCSVPRLGAVELDAELSRSALALREHDIPEPLPFAYPYGQVSDVAPYHVASAGYDVAFTTEPFAVTTSSDPFRLPRVPVPAEWTASSLCLRTLLARLLHVSAAAPRHGLKAKLRALKVRWIPLTERSA